MTTEERRQVQRDLNRFTDRCLHGVTHLVVDGKGGPATEKRIQYAYYWCGRNRPYRVGADKRLRKAIRRPHHPRFSTPAELARGSVRRLTSRRRTRANEKAAVSSTGVSVYRGGRPVANWIHPYLDWARANGWQGQVNSGFREPAYSESLCYRMCGAPSCSGRCAGRSSGHSQQVKPGGCIDVSDYTRFGQLMARCPLQPHLQNLLGARDPVHFSYTGH